MSYATDTDAHCANETCILNQTVGPSDDTRSSGPGILFFLLVLALVINGLVLCTMCMEHMKRKFGISMSCLFKKLQDKKMTNIRQTIYTIPVQDDELTNITQATNTIPGFPSESLSSSESSTIPQSETSASSVSHLDVQSLDRESPISDLDVMETSTVSDLTPL